MRGRWRTWLRAVAVAFAASALASGEARAGARLPCPEARVFSDAAVNAVILPYRYAGRDRVDLASSASRLAALIQQETLFAMLKYGSVGATELVSEGGEICDPREVLSRIQGPNDHPLLPGRAVVLVWGRIYEEGPDVFVQSYLRFQRGGEREGLSVELPGEAGPPLRLEAALPPLAVAMVPRKLSRQDIAEIERRARDTLVLHDEPGGPSRRPLAESPHVPLAYGVIGSKGDWMKIQSYITHEQGWVRARQDDDAWALRRFLPELGYLEGVVAYLRLRTAALVPMGGEPQRVVGWMRRAFAGYERAVGRDAAPEAAGLARAMTAHVLWSPPGARGAGPGNRAEAARLFREAAAALASSSDANVLAAVTAAYVVGSARIDQGTWAGLERGLLGAVAMDPRNPVAVADLEQLYAFALRSGRVARYGAEELSRRAEAVRAARAQLERR